MTTAEKLVEDFRAHGWKSNPFDRLFKVLNEERGDALPLAISILDQLPKGGTFFHALLSHLNEDEFGQLIRAAIAKLETGESDAAESVIAYGSLQFPVLLRPYLRQIFRLSPNAGTYYEYWPWRAADDQEVIVLQAAIESKQPLPTRQRAWMCLLWTGRPELLAYAHDWFQRLGISDVGFGAYAHMIGFDVSDGEARKLYSEPSHHIVFSADYFEDTTRPAWLARANHPTWILSSAGSQQAEFGGTVSTRCGICAGQLHRLFKIEDTSSLALSITLPHIDVCTCLSCLGWESPILFFVHDESGSPRSLAMTDSPRQPEFPAGPLKPTQVAIVKTPPRWGHQSWGHSNSRENLNRVGGFPAWIQSAEYPPCPKCKHTMPFIAQLDSDLPTAESGEWLWGSGGICYIFWCDRCRVSANLWQCT